MTDQQTTPKIYTATVEVEHELKDLTPLTPKPAAPANPPTTYTYTELVLNNNKSDEAADLSPPSKRRTSNFSKLGANYLHRFYASLLQLLAPRTLIMIAMILTFVILNHKDVKAISGILQQAMATNIQWIPSALSSPQIVKCTYYSDELISSQYVTALNLSSAIAKCCFRSDGHDVDEKYLGNYAFLAKINSTCTTYPCDVCFYLLQ